jgi:hypothetical protein
MDMEDQMVVHVIYVKVVPIQSDKEMVIPNVYHVQLVLLV